MYNNSVRIRLIADDSILRCYKLSVFILQNIIWVGICYNALMRTYVFCEIIIAVVAALSIGGHCNPVIVGDIMTYSAVYTDHIIGNYTRL